MLCTIEPRPRSALAVRAATLRPATTSSVASPAEIALAALLSAVSSSRRRAASCTSSHQLGSGSREGIPAAKSDRMLYGMPVLASRVNSTMGSVLRPARTESWIPANMALNWGLWKSPWVIPVAATVGSARDGAKSRHPSTARSACSACGMFGSLIV